MEEAWQKTDGNYEVSNFGKVRNSKTGKMLTSGRESDGTRVVYLWIDGKRQKRRLKRLVAESFSVKDISDAYVQTINGDEEDVCSDNLELRSKYNGKKIKVVETGQVYSSIDECSNILGISRSTISRCVNYPFYSNRLNYHFEYVD